MFPPIYRIRVALHLSVLQRVEIFQYRILFFYLISFVGLEITLKVLAGITILTFMEKTSFKSFYMNKMVLTNVWSYKFSCFSKLLFDLYCSKSKPLSDGLEIWSTYEIIWWQYNVIIVVTYCSVSAKINSTGQKSSTFSSIDMKCNTIGLQPKNSQRKSLC